MNITFLGQGFGESSPNSIGEYLMRFFGQTGFQKFTGISAFASEAAVKGLSQCISLAKESFEEITLIVGIDQGGTSKEALNEIIALEINSYIFYQKESPIFHPKIYLFEGATETKIIVGSSNLTAKGLFSNVESSLLVEFASHDEEGMSLLAQLKDYYSSLFNFSDPNLFPITEILIEGFIEQGLIPSELERIIHNRKQINISANQQNEVPMRLISKIPRRFLAKTRTIKKNDIIAEELVSEDTLFFEESRLVWRKHNLANSDAQQAGTANTAVTGNIKLSQASFKMDSKYIDHVVYFRDEVFPKLDWYKPHLAQPTYEEALCDFHVIINGTDLAIFKLIISHDPLRAANQRNVTTWLHLGEKLGRILREEFNVLGKSIRLYLPQKGSEIYYLFIS